MQDFVDLSLDEFKQELNRVVFPVFVCLFLQMVQKKGFEQAAGEFFARYAEGFRAKHRADINVLETVHDVSRL